MNVTELPHPLTNQNPVFTCNQSILTDFMNPTVFLKRDLNVMNSYMLLDEAVCESAVFCVQHVS